MVDGMRQKETTMGLANSIAVAMQQALNDPIQHSRQIKDLAFSYAVLIDKLNSVDF